MTDQSDNKLEAELIEHREAINRIDQEFVRLLAERSQSVSAIGEAKLRRGESIFVPHREQDVFARVCSYNQGPLPDKGLRAIWREIMSASIALEQPITICHFGYLVLFTHHQAARLKFGDAVSYSSVEAITRRLLALFGTWSRRLWRGTHRKFHRWRHHRYHRCLPCHAAAHYQRAAFTHSPPPHGAGLSRPDQTDLFKKYRFWPMPHLKWHQHSRRGISGSWLDPLQAHESIPYIHHEGPPGHRQRRGRWQFLLRNGQRHRSNPTNTTRFVVIMPTKPANPTGNDKTSLMFGPEP